MEQNITQVTMSDFWREVKNLYTSHDPALTREANTFWYKFESFDQAWDISIQVLSTENLSDEAYFNAIQILKNKIKYYLGNYTESNESITKLLLFLIEQITKFSQAKQYILNNFCRCFALGLVFSGNNFHTLIKHAVTVLRANTDANNQTSANETNWMSLLMIFNFLAENCMDRNIVIDDSSKQLFTKNWDSIQSDVIIYIDYLIRGYTGASSESKWKKYFSYNILECIINWWSFGWNGNVLNYLTNNNSIIQFVFDVDGDNWEKHSECICQFLWLPLETEEMKTVLKFVFNKIIYLKTEFYKSDGNLSDDQICFYVDVFSTMCNNNIDNWFREKRIDFFKLMSDWISICPYKKIDYIIDFWMRFTQYLSEQEISREEILQEFKEIYSKNIYSFIKLCKFEQSVFKQLNEGKKKKWKNNEDYLKTEYYRDSTKQYLYSFIQDYSFKYFYDTYFVELLKQSIEIWKNNKTEIDNWATFEALLFTFECVVKGLSHGDSEGIVIWEDLFNIIFEVPGEWIQITRTVSDIIDASSKLFYNNIPLLGKIILYLSNNTSNKYVQKYCIVSLQYLFTDNKKYLFGSKTDLLSWYNTKIKNEVLSNDKFLPLLEGIVEVICYMPSASESINNTSNNLATNSTPSDPETEDQTIRTILLEIFKQWVLYLEEAKQKSITSADTMTDKERDTISDLLLIIKSISRAAFNSLSKRNLKIMSDIFEELWPKLKVLISTFATDGSLTESIIQVVKFYMREWKDTFKKYFQEYISSIINGYKVTPISSYWYGFEVLITAFADDDSVLGILSGLLTEFIQYTLENYLKTREDWLMKEKILLGQDFFGLIYRTIWINSTLLFNCVEFENVLLFLINNINIGQLEMTKNILHSISLILNYTDNKALKYLQSSNPNEYERYENWINEKILKVSDLLVSQLIDTYISAPVETIEKELRECVFNFMKFSNETSKNKFYEKLKTIPSTLLVNSEKESFIRAIESKNKMELDKLIYILYKRSITMQRRGNNFQA